MGEARRRQLAREAAYAEGRKWKEPDSCPACRSTRIGRSGILPDGMHEEMVRYFGPIVTDTPTAYPLAWPSGWPRTPATRRAPAKFRSGRHASDEIRLTDARDRLQRELDRMGAGGPILSTNLRLRLDGLPRAGEPAPADPGAAVYFTLKKRPIVLACDRWTKVAGNIAAIAAHLDAMRGMDRWGVGSVEQLFTGYAALPAPLSPGDWRTLLRNPTTLAAAEATYRELMRAAHPDAGGSHAAAAALNEAISQARMHLK